jgi:hypothetical protein
VTDFDQSGELEPGEAVRAELTRLAHHARQESRRLHDVAEAGQTGSSVFIEIAAVARWLIPILLLMVGVLLSIYFAVR